MEKSGFWENAGTADTNATNRHEFFFEPQRRRSGIESRHIVRRQVSKDGATGRGWRPAAAAGRTGPGRETSCACRWKATVFLEAIGEKGNSSAKGLLLVRLAHLRG